MVYRITVKDEAVYELNSAEYSKEEAVNQALDWFDERKPHVEVDEKPDSALPRWAVIDRNGSFIGDPCLSEEAARELACQQEGRQIFQMYYDSLTDELWS